MPVCSASELLDMTCATPQEAWTDADATLFEPVSSPSSARWRIIDYECQQHAGRMICAVGEDAPVVQIPLQKTGWHAVYLLVGYINGVQSGLEARLTGESTWCHVPIQPPLGSQSWCERGFWGAPLVWEPWRFADLTGKDLEIRVARGLLKHVITDHNPAASLWGVRAVPLPQEHVVRIQTPSRTCRSISFNDGFSCFYYAHTPGLHIVDEEVAPFLGDEWDTVCFGTGQTGFPNHPSKHICHRDKCGWMFGRKGDQRYQQNILTMVENGDDVLLHSVQLAHQAKQRSWVYLRPQLWSMPPFSDHCCHADFFEQNPSLRCLEADGTAISKMSFAYPQVRAQMAAQIQEAVERGTDGICLVLTRGLPLVRYEDPVCQRFREQYGDDARTLPETDARLQGVWADIVTEWIREVRDLLDAATDAGRARRLELAVHCYDLPMCQRLGMDIERWVKDGLIDALLPAAFSVDEVARFAQMTNDSATALLPDITYKCHYQPAGTLPRDKTIAWLRRMAHACYQCGADGLAFWDTETHMANLQLNRPDEQELWCGQYAPPAPLPLVSLAGQALMPFHPGLGA